MFQYPSQVENSAIQYLVQLGEYSPEIEVKTMILQNILQPVFFTELRTQKQLGYTVNVSREVNSKFAHLIFTIQSADYSSLQLHQEIESFIESVPVKIDSVSDDSFAKTKQSILQSLLAPPDSFEQVEAEKWFAIVNQTPNFGEKTRWVEVLKQTTKKDIVEFVKQTLLSEKRHALSIHVLDKDDQALKTIPNATLIKNIDAFKKSQIYLKKEREALCQ